MAKPKVEEIECGTFYGKPLIFRPKSHRYFFGGQPIPSVTTILGRADKPNLKDWIGRVTVEMVKSLADEMEDGRYRIHHETLDRCQHAYRIVRDEAGDVGRFLHKYAEYVLQGERPPLPTNEQERQGVKSFEDWLGQNDVEPIALERRVVSEKHFYAGTTDFFGLVNGRRSILDFKSGKYIYDEAWFQAEAYALALEEEGATEAPIEEKHIIRLGKETGEFEAAKRKISEIDRAPFLALLSYDKAIRAWGATNRAEELEAE